MTLSWVSVVHAEGETPVAPSQPESEEVVESVADEADVEPAPEAEFASEEAVVVEEEGDTVTETDTALEEAAPVVEEEVDLVPEADTAPEEATLPNTVCETIIVVEDEADFDADDPCMELAEPEETILEVAAPAEADISEEPEDELEDEPDLQPSPLNLQPTVPDPYFYIGGEKHSYLPTGGDCGGAANCSVSTTPIQDALNAVTGGLTPDDGTVYIEGGEFDEFVNLNNFAGELTLQGGANGSETILTGGVSLSQVSGNVRLRNFSFEAGVSAINTANLTIADSSFNAGLVVLNSQDVQLENTEHDAGIVISGSSQVNVEGSTFNAGVIVSGSQAVTLTGTQVNAALVVVASDVRVVGSEEDDHVEAELEDDASTLAVSGGGGKDKLSVKLNTGQASLATQKVTAGTSLVQYDESVESLSVEAVNADVEIIEDVALLGELEVEAEAIMVSKDVSAVSIALTAAAELEQAAGTQVTATQSVAYTAGTMLIAGELHSDGDIELNAADGISLEAGATISAAGNLVINADTDGDGIGIFEQATGAVIEAQLGDVSIIAADIMIEDKISAPLGDVILQTSTPDVVILLGDTGTGFELSNAELAQIHPGANLTL
ncbi:MAG: right-handed parallel beta-helix repeat-containing protein, partial [Anaerolineae bacterium]|nr:right-handed parallel beta-helix repeat-containing protein [Anaerolineae bacterium]